MKSIGQVDLIKRKPVPGKDVLSYLVIIERIVNVIPTHQAIRWREDNINSPAYPYENKENLKDECETLIQ
jgi:hypothetical protein